MVSLDMELDEVVGVFRGMVMEWLEVVDAQNSQCWMSPEDDSEYKRVSLVGQVVVSSQISGTVVVGHIVVLGHLAV